MKGTTIYDRGYEVEINVVPDIGTPAVDDIFEKINRKLALGRSVSLSDIQRMFGVKSSKRTDGYRLDPKIMRENEMDYDWQYLFEDDPAMGQTVYGRKIIIWGLISHKRSRTPHDIYKEKRKYEPEDNFRYEDNTTL